MAWIEVHQSLPTHAKTVEAAALLDVPEVEVVGHMVCLWLWAVDNAREGRINVAKPLIIAKAARWAGEPGRFVDALIAAGFVDEGGCIHDWDEYTGRLMERRERVQEQTRERVKRWREQRKTPAVSGESVRNANSNALPVTPVTLGNAPTVPNPTVPNRTRPTATTPVDRVAPAAPDAPLSEASAIVPASITFGRKRDLVFEAIQAVWPSGPLTDVERGRWNKAAKELRDGGVTPDQILTAARNWPNVMGASTMTPMGIASNLGLLLEGPQVNGRSNGTTLEHRQRVTETAHAPIGARAVIEAKKAQRALTRGDE